MNNHPAHQEILAARGIQEKIADAITAFAGSMKFVYIHMVWFSLWIGLKVEKYPFGLLTMIVSLEAIFLATFVMVSQNRQAALASAKAAHDYFESEQLLKRNTELTEKIKLETALLKEIHEHVTALSPSAGHIQPD